MASYSGFISNFLSNLPNSGIDILSSPVSTKSSYTLSAGGSGEISAVYFYLGNLLIQYSNLGTSSRVNIPNNTTCNIQFPISYGVVIPTVFITPPLQNGTLCVSATNSFSFNVVPGTNNNAYPNWIAIGTVPFKATGIYTISTNSSWPNVTITFTGNGSIVFYSNFNVTYIAVGPGGSGGAAGSGGGGGGGGGQVASNTFNTNLLQQYDITFSTTNTNISSIVNCVAGGNGGSNSGPGGTSGNGFPGGFGSFAAGIRTGGGGGGSAGAGGNGSGTGGAGGPGTVFTVNGSQVTYGAGGAGGANNTSGVVPGAPNTGNGGSGGNNGNGGAGGSGVVILTFSLD